MSEAYQAGEPEHSMYLDVPPPPPPPPVKNFQSYIYLYIMWYSKTKLIRFTDDIILLWLSLRMKEPINSTAN